ncbi:MAG: hypothetical protein K6T16_01720 [Candidatus Pacearchaeota archaeon]|nr:hypothetical protein [Candidatus Pacearchaeota archaeon]
MFLRAAKEKIKGNEWALDIKIYDFGVVTIRLWTSVRGSTREITKLLNSSEAELKKKAYTFLNKLLEEIKNFIPKPDIETEKAVGNYTLFFIQKFERVWKPDDLKKRFGGEIARMLRYEERELSDQEVKDVLKTALSYYNDDLTVIDFNSALVYDPRKSYDVPDVLEYAVIELTELRVYDQFLDNVIEATYEELSKKRFFTGRGVINKLSQVKLEVSEVKEKVENFIKLIDDSYLGKIYVASSTRFYLDKWKSSVKEKLDLLEALYSKGWERVQTKRMVILEATIVVLFILDILLVLWELLGKKFWG